MYKPTHLTKLFVSLSTAMFLLTGCATAQKELFVLPQEPSKNITVYVDNSIDLERQKNAVESYVWAINNTDSFKVEVNESPTVAPLNIQYKPATSYISCEGNIKESHLLPNIKFVTYNYEYAGDLLEKNRNIRYYDNKYSAIKLNDNSFEIKGFNSKKEAMDVFVELMRSTVPEYKNEVISISKNTSTGITSEAKTKTTRIHKFILALRQAPLPENILYSREYWDLSQFYPGRGFVFDPFVLEKENRLIVKPIIEAYSLKKQFLNVLKAGGYTIVENKNDAQMLIKTQNLYYGTTSDLKNSLPIINKRLNKESKEHDSAKNLAKETESLTNQASVASDLGNNDIAKGMVGVAAANLVLNFLSSDGRYDGYFISAINVEYKGQEILNIPNFMKLDKTGEVYNQTLCVPESRAFKSSRMFLKSIENKLSELK